VDGGPAEDGGSFVFSADSFSKSLVFLKSRQLCLLFHGSEDPKFHDSLFVLYYLSPKERGASSLFFSSTVTVAHPTVHLLAHPLS